MNKNLEKNEQLIIAATNYARAIFNVDEYLWVFINELNHFTGIDHSALYDKEHFLIRYNREWLKSAKVDNIIKTAFHEVFHVVQHLAILEYDQGKNNGFFTNQDLKRMKHEFLDENYSTKLGKYEELLIEQQAEEFALYLYKEYKKTFKDESELVSKFLNLFVNKED